MQTTCQDNRENEHCQQGVSYILEDAVHGFAGANPELQSFMRSEFSRVKKAFGLLLGRGLSPAEARRSDNTSDEYITAAKPSYLSLTTSVLCPPAMKKGTGVSMADTKYVSSCSKLV